MTSIQNLSLKQIEAMIDLMRSKGVAQFQIGDFIVSFKEGSAPVDTQTVEPEPKADVALGPDGLTADEAKLAYAST